MGLYAFSHNDGGGAIIGTLPTLREACEQAIKVYAREAAFAVSLVVVRDEETALYRMEDVTAYAERCKLSDEIDLALHSISVEEKDALIRKMARLLKLEEKS